MKFFNHLEIPRPIRADAYTISSSIYESDEAKEQSVYGIVFRRKPSVYSDFIPKNDDRIIFGGLNLLILDLLEKPVTHEEIDRCIPFFLNRKATMKGVANFDWPEQLWRDIVDKYGGRIPVVIEAMPEGSTIYPNEPMVRVRSLVKGYGPFAAWMEAEFLKVWAASEYLTDSRQWLNYNKTLITALNDGSITWSGTKVIYSKPKYELPEKFDVDFLAGLQLTDFGYRSGMTPQESAWFGMYHLLCFSGTDTFSGSYLAWKNGAAAGIGNSVLAHAHRTVMGYKPHHLAYPAIYDAAKDNEIISEVADLYDYRYDVAHYLLPLALRSKVENNGKVVVARPDSAKDEADMIDQILGTINLAVANGLYTIAKSGLTQGTFLKVLQGDGMDKPAMMRVDNAIMNAGHDPMAWKIFGCGGGLRNGLKRDDLSAKYYLCSVGFDERQVVKDSENAGKRTLPDVKVLRTPESLQTGETIVLPDEEGLSAYVEYYNGLRSANPFGQGMKDDFMVIRDRVLNEFDVMPLTAGIPSESVLTLREQIRKAAYNVPN